MTAFYDDLAPYYHLIFGDWQASVDRQGKQLATLIANEWPGARTLLDVCCDIGTQASAWRCKAMRRRRADSA